MTQTLPDTCAAFAGIDWADANHDGCLQVTGTAKRECSQLEHTPEAIETWGTTLRTRCSGQPIAICLARTKGPLVSAWRKYNFLVLFPIHPLTLARYREAFTPSRAQDDPTDAALPLALLLTHRDKLPRLQPQSPTMRALAQLVAHRRRLVGDTVRLTNRLTSALKNYFPQGLQWFQDKDTHLFCDLLSRWPTLTAAQLARRSTLEAFLRDHHGYGEDVLAKRLHAIKTATPLTTDAGVIAPQALLVQALPSQLRVTLDALEAFDQALAQRAQWHPDCPLLQALPGAGPGFASRLLVAFGEQRARYTSAAALQKYAGVAPVTERSGKKAWVPWRLQWPKFLRQTCVEWAAESMRHSCWAQGLLSAATCQGQDASGRCARPGIHLDPSALSVLAGSHPVRCIRLSPGPLSPWPKCGRSVLNNCKNTLTAPLRACVQCGMYQAALPEHPFGGSLMIP